MSTFTEPLRYGYEADKRIEVGFSEKLNGREHEFPLLARALVGAKPALAPRIEWLYQSPEGIRSAMNYCQIIRFPYDGKPVEEGSDHRFFGGPTPHSENLAGILEAVERILWDGVPKEDLDNGYVRRTCGGVRHYLGRDPIDGDKITLRPLRDLIWWRHGEGTEWLAEFSLQVTPA